MKQRIKLLRKELGLTQQEFADKLGIKRTTIGNYELGRNEPVDSVISLICDRCHVNETWLRTGNGDMFEQVSRDDELLRLIDESMTEESGEFKRRLALAIMKLNADQIKACREWILDNFDIIGADSRKNEIDRKVEEYRAELEAQAAFSKLEASQNIKEGTGLHKTLG